MLKSAKHVLWLSWQTAFAQIVNICILCHVTVVSVWHVNIARLFSEQSCARSIAAEGGVHAVAVNKDSADLWVKNSQLP